MLNGCEDGQRHCTIVNKASELVKRKVVRIKCANIRRDKEPRRDERSVNIDQGNCPQRRIGLQ